MAKEIKQPLVSKQATTWACLLQDTDNSLQDEENTYGDLLSYPSASEELLDISLTLREKLQAAACSRVSYPHLSN